MKEEKTEKVEDLKVESLDDLFETSETENIEEPKVEEKPENKNETQEVNQQPIIPQPIDIEEDDGGIDLQKELEAKFDELFGPFEDEDENQNKTGTEK